MWNIIPKSKPYFTCRQCQLVNYIEYMNKNPRALFQISHGYRYKPVSSQLASCIFYSDQDRDVMKNTYGIVINEQYLDDVEMLRHYIRENLKSSPILVEMDAYDCPWNKGYHLLHQKHFFLVIDYNATENSCIVSDSYCSEQLIHFYLNKLLEWHGCVSVFIHTDDKENLFDEKSTYLSIAQQHLQHDYIQDIEMMRYHILDTLTEILGKIGGTAPLDSTFYTIQTIAYQKVAYTEYLSLCQEQLGEVKLNKLKQDYLRMAKKYEELKILLIKHSIINKIDKDAISSKFDQLIFIEKGITFCYSQSLNTL